MNIQYNKSIKIIFSAFLLGAMFIPMCILTQFTDPLSGDYICFLDAMYNETYSIPHTRLLGFGTASKFGIHLSVNDFQSTLDNNGNVTSNTIKIIHRKLSDMALLTVILFFLDIFLLLSLLNKYAFHLKIPNFLLFFSSFIFLVLNMFSEIQRFFYDLIDYM